MKDKRAIVVFATLMFIVASDLYARSPTTTSLSVDLAKREIYVNAAAKPELIGVAYYRTVHSEETTEIIIRHANPLILKYSVNVETSPSESAESVEKFATALGTLLGRFGNLGADAPTGVVEGLNLVAFKNLISKTFLNVDGVGDWIDLSLKPATLDQLKDETKGLPKDAEALGAGYEKALRIHLKCMRGEMLVSDGGPIPCTAPVDARPVLVERQLGSEYGLLKARLEELDKVRAPWVKADAAVQSAKSAVTANELALKGATAKNSEALKKKLEKMLEESRAAVSQAEAVRVPLQPLQDAYLRGEKMAEDARTSWNQAKAAMEKAQAEADAQQRTIANFLRDALAIQTQAEKAAAFLKGFAGDVDRVGDKSMKSIDYTLDTTTVTIKVDKETKYANYLSPAAKQAQAAAKEAKIVIKPYRVATVRPGVAFVLGFLENPEFAATKAGDKYKITATKTELTKFNVAAMINIVPRRWDEPTFGGFFQLGVSPKNDETGFYFGTGVQMENALTFGVGGMIQQVRRLGAGQKVDDLLNSPDELKVERKFKTAFYIHATVTLTKKK